MKRLAGFIVAAIILGARSRPASAGGCPGAWAQGCYAMAGRVLDIRIINGFVEIPLATYAPDTARVEHLGQWDMRAEYYKCGDRARLEDIKIGDYVVVTKKGMIDWEVLVEDFSECAPSFVEEGDVGATKVGDGWVELSFSTSAAQGEDHWTRLEPRNRSLVYHMAYYWCGEPSAFFDIEPGDHVTVTKRLVGEELATGYDVTVEDSSRCEERNGRPRGEIDTGGPDYGS